MTNPQELGLSHQNACKYPESWTVHASHEIIHDVVVSHDLVNIDNPVSAMTGTVSTASGGSRRLIAIDFNVDSPSGTGPGLTSAADTVISMSIQLMLKELQPSLRRTELERCVDFGHAFSPTEAVADTQRHRREKQRTPLPVGVGNHAFVDDATEKKSQQLSLC